MAKTDDNTCGRLSYCKWWFVYEREHPIRSMETLFSQTVHGHHR